MRAHLAMGDSSAAFEDLHDGLQAHRALAEEQTAFSAIVRLALLPMVCSAIGDGLAEHRWAEPELRKIADELARLNPLREYRVALSSERAVSNGFYDQLSSSSPIKRSQILSFFIRWPKAEIEDVLPLMPRRFFRENELRANRYVDELLARVDVEEARVNFDATTRLSAIDRFPDKLWFALFGFLNSGYGSYENHFLSVHTFLDQARIACAAERYWLAHGWYPESLSELVPTYLPKIPTDIYSAAPMKYQRFGDGSFRLYSVGKNRTDEGSDVDPKAHEGGDIIWLYAPSEPALR
jgi:hypothetical protein